MTPLATSCICLLLLAAVSVARAQTTFVTVTGLVTDPNGTAVPGAVITVTHLVSN